MARHFPNKPRKTAKKSALPGLSSARPDWRALVAAHSPYLSQNLAQQPAAAVPPDIDAQLAALAAESLRETETAGLMRLLRQEKRRLATQVAAADLSAAWDDLAVMRALSQFADAAVRAALRLLLMKAHAAKIIRLPFPKEPLRACGVSVIALGKWGAYELNYSSDIDLMVIFDPQRSPVRDREETQNFFIRLTRDLARLLDQPTEDGYVFRTDLRLRPDPGAMPLAVSLSAAETYYGSLGQNWERAAMIKARPVAGDAALGEDFMKIMTAWIWRRNLDFAAIQDIHSIKRQINSKIGAKQAAKGKARAGDNPFLGFNVKLGHGGIREIEFFAQTQQLIYGGREPALRQPSTLEALTALAAAGHITVDLRDRLSAAYLFLRRTEHRLQMQEDRQTHSLPENAEGFAGVAAFMEYARPERFIADLEAQTGAVRKAYAALFTESPALDDSGNLVFTGVEDDPETLETLRGMGFMQPGKITAGIRGWHHGRYRAMRSDRARQILTELVPGLLKTLSRTPRPDDAFIHFDQFLSRLPAGIPIFSMFQRHRQQMELVAEIMGTSPALSEYLGNKPQVLDGVLSRDFFGGLPDLAALRADLARMLDTARDYEDALNIVRRWAREKRFHAGIHILKNLSPQEDCARYLSDIAEAALGGITPHVERNFAEAHGVFKTGAFILLAMGSFAAREMYTDSDLDIIALYKTAPREKQSNGAKPLPPNVYYIRLMQRLIAALSAPTAEGKLYDVDARLRPAGEDGPLAAQLDGFFDYHRHHAWAFEHMSLLRSRVVYAPEKTAAAVTAEIAGILSAPRDVEKLRRDMLEMRARVEKQFGSKDAWNFKYRRGGLMDIMFAVHYLVLSHAATHKDLLQAPLDAAIAALKKAKLLKAADAKTLLDAHHAAQALQGFLRLSAELPFKPDKAGDGLKTALMRRVAAGAKKSRKSPDFQSFAKETGETFSKSYALYKSILGA